MSPTAFVAEISSCGPASIQNVPKPMGDEAGTRTVDENKERFFLPEEEAAPLDISAKAVERLCGGALRGEDVEAGGTSHLEDAPNGEAIAGYLGEWYGAPNAEAHSVPVMLVSTGAAVTAVSKEVAMFCVREGLLQSLLWALEIAAESFPEALSSDVGLEEDPEGDDQWVSLGVTVKGDEPDVSERYNGFTEQWVARVPWPERDRIRLCYYFE